MHRKVVATFSDLIFFANCFFLRLQNITAQNILKFGVLIHKSVSAITDEKVGSYSLVSIGFSYRFSITQTVAYMPPHGCQIGLVTTISGNHRRTGASPSHESG